MASTPLLWFVLPLLTAVGTPFSQDPDRVDPDRADPKQADREAKFAAQMSGCKMVGSYTVTGKPLSELAEDSYTIRKVEKLRDDDWRFDTTIEYAGKKIVVPIVVQVVWAGDTATIQVTDLMVPMSGKYSARVVIYGNQYAGLWSGGTFGGHMFGRIERANANEAAADATAAGGEAVGRDEVGATTERAAAAGADVRAAASSRGGDWMRWRGPSGNGSVADANPPLTWSETENVRWKVPLPGLGSSTPIVLGDRIYLTTAVRTDRDGELPAVERPDGNRGRGRGRGQGGQRGERGAGGGGSPRGGDARGGGRRRGRGFGNSEPDTKIHEFLVVALNRADGEVVWTKKVAEAVPHERGHSTASQASNSPITDGEHIYAHFGSRGLHCLDLDGNVKWSRDFGYMFTRNQFGEGASPALYGDVLVVNWDHEGDSFLVALDKTTGDELWRRDRDEVTSWSTPRVIPVDGTPQVIVSATGATRGYDLASGDVIWSLSGMTTNAIPTPLYENGVVWVMSGFRGSMLQAIELAGAKGDLADSKNVLWSHNRNTSYVPSGLLYDGNLYFMRVSSGVLSCLDAKTGKVHYEGQRLRGVRTVYASPVGAAGRVYITSREGTTLVLKAGDSYEQLASNTLEDGFDASLILLGDEIYLRGREHLYCIAEED